MIKLIATDMDGTLLNSSGELPKGFFKVLEDLTNRGVMFVAASGRQYATLVENFSKAKDNIMFAAENGSFVVYRGKELFSKTLSNKIAMDIIKDARKIKDCKIVLCGKNSAYIEDDEPKFMEQVNKYYHKNKLVNNLEEVKDEFLKIALYDLKGASQNSNKIMNPKWGEILQVTVSGENWLDLGRSDINKGVAIQFIQDKFGVSHEETMVFGDYFNDIHMLQSAYHSYVMVNAPEGVKKYGRFIAKSNDEDGVVEVIKNKVLKKEA
ncbi:haloacid dehalogenase [Clostridium polyendosporum]|uniref:Haloacid dehalogenase n=1 Tax=Clostridium polyendosporum TaxID=69208 RepID=A0A919RXL7_9CLOT|nr:HAD family hydrolase [Clostridium polyendosporum]GIM28149.1 haloacid dehalogenase [Clostridium polyendosporum]